MKKTVSIILVAIMMLSAALNISAYGDASNIHTFGNISVIFEDDSALTFEEQAATAKMIIAKSNGDATTYNLLCTLFGHTYDVETVTTVTHKVNSSAPRCLEEHYNMSTCSRCGNQQLEFLYSQYIDCCK